MAHRSRKRLFALGVLPLAALAALSAFSPSEEPAAEEVTTELKATYPQRPNGALLSMIEESTTTTTTTVPPTTTTTTTTAPPPPPATTTTAPPPPPPPPPTTTTVPPPPPPPPPAPTPAPTATGACGGWEGVIAAYFPGDQVAKACSVMMCESKGYTGAENPSSSASGAWQFLSSTWQSTTGLAPPASAYSMDTQTAAAAELWRRAGWGQWSCA